MVPQICCLRGPFQLLNIYHFASFVPNTKCSYFLVNIANNFDSKTHRINSAVTQYQFDKMFVSI